QNPDLVLGYPGRYDYRIGDYHRDQHGFRPPASVLPIYSVPARRSAPRLRGRRAPGAGQVPAAIPKRFRRTRNFHLGRWHRPVNRPEAAGPGGARARPAGISFDLPRARVEPAWRGRWQVLVLSPGAQAHVRRLVPDAATSFYDRRGSAFLLPAGLSSDETSALAGEGCGMFWPGRFYGAGAFYPQR